MPYEFDDRGYPTYHDNNTYLRASPVIPSPRHSPYHTPVPSPHVSPNSSPMYLDENYNYYQPGTGYVGVPMMPAGFVPLPPSPSALSAMFVPLPPSPRISPRRTPVPLSPGGMLSAYPQYQQPHYSHPYDPFYFPQAGNMYMNPTHVPQAKINHLLQDSRYVKLDLSLPTFSPLTASGGWQSSQLRPVHEGYLEGIASYPAVTEMTITCKAFGKFEQSWKINIRLRDAIRVGDVLRYVHAGMRTQVTHAEWASMSQTDVLEASRSYTRRTRVANSESETMNGVLRVDLLRDKYYFDGIKRIREDDPYNFELKVKSK